MCGCYRVSTPRGGKRLHSANLPGIGAFLVRTNSVQQISTYGSVSANNAVSIEVLGWFDDLGKFN